MGCHFGSRSHLIRARLERSTEPVERIRERMPAEVGASADVRDRVGCLVRPVTEYLAALGTPS
ncbi:hypothetical protein ACIP2Y_07885 [Streptomyces sviceus]|uniref:hypothetical protein n=1 Tax=Streptomyces sviceus TaxID=285530 RepID=UPI003801AC62